MPITINFLPLMGAAFAGAFVTSRYNALPLSTTISAALPAAFLIWLVWVSYIYPFYVSPLRTIPTVPGFPLWGQFKTIVTTECGVPIREWHEQYGPVIRYFFPFGAERLSIADDDAIKQMTIRNPYNYPKPVRAKLWMVRILGEGVLLAEGQTHVHQRKALAPGFSITSIRSLALVFWAKSLHLAKLWSDSINAENTNSTNTDNTKSKVFEVLEWLNRTTLDIIGQAGFGSDIDSLDNPETPIREAYRLVFAFDIWSRVLHGLAAFMPITKHLPAQMNRDMLAARKIILAKASQIIKEKEAQAKSEKTQQKDIIGLIVRDNMKASMEDTLSFEAMRDQVMTFLGAGHDTTATSVAWCLHLLAKHPEHQTKLREEIREHMPFLFDDNTRDNEDILSKTDVDLLPFMDDVCRESLRYIPSIPMTVRQSVKDDKLAGYDIPAGTTIYIMANAINRLSMYWGSSANEFDPSRWRNLPSTWTTNAYMTFLQGPRGCIGRKFAEIEMKTLLCCLLSKFTFESDGSQDPEELKMWRLVLRPRDGVSLKTTFIS